MGPPTEEDLSPQYLGRAIASWMLCIFQIIFALLHLYSPLAYRMGQQSTTYVVSYITTLGPYWVVLFGITGILLLVSLMKQSKWRWKAHLSCGSIFCGYTAALFTGAIFDHPFGPFTYPAMSLVITIGHALLMLSYGGDR